MYDFSRRNTSYGSLGTNTLQIANQMKFLFDEFLEFRLPEKEFHHIQTFVDRFDFFQREYNPAFQHSGSHRADGVVDNIQQAGTAFIHAAHKFQTAYRKFIQAYEAVLFNA